MRVDERIRKFIQDNFYVDDVSRLTDDASLINEGIVDSTGMLEVIAFLESEYKFRVLDTETVPANLETIGRITAFVQKKLAAPVAKAS